MPWNSSAFHSRFTHCLTLYPITKTILFVYVKHENVSFNAAGIVCTQTKGTDEDSPHDSSAFFLSARNNERILMWWSVICLSRAKHYTNCYIINNFARRGSCFEDDSNAIHFSFDNSLNRGNNLLENWDQTNKSRPMWVWIDLASLGFSMFPILFLLPVLNLLIVDIYLWLFVNVWPWNNWHG